MTALPSEPAAMTSTTCAVNKRTGNVCRAVAHTARSFVSVRQLPQDSLPTCT